MDKLTEWKLTLTAAVFFIADLLGWKGVLIISWVLAMALDYASGTFAALRMGEWDSKVARDGLWHKGGMILVILVSGTTDILLAMMARNMGLAIHYTGLVLPLALIWYNFTELGSVLENSVKMGAPVPKWLVKFLKAGKKYIEKTAEGVHFPEAENNIKEEK